MVTETGATLVRNVFFFMQLVRRAAQKDYFRWMEWTGIINTYMYVNGLLRCLYNLSALVKGCNNSRLQLLIVEYKQFIRENPHHFPLL
jgi:hypothetical protein